MCVYMFFYVTSTQSIPPGCFFLKNNDNSLLFLLKKKRVQFPVFALPVDTECSVRCLQSLWLFLLTMKATNL